MDMGGRMRLGQEGEQLKGLEIEPLETLSEEDERAVRSLRFSMLDETSDHDVIERGKKLDTMAESMRRVGTRDGCIIPRDEGRVVGFLSFEKSAGEIQVQELLVAQKHNEEDVLTQLMHEAEKMARGGGYTCMTITPLHPSEDFLTICRLMQYRRAETEDEGAHLVKNLSSLH